MNQTALFTFDSPQKRAPKKKGAPRLGKKPQPRTCPTCHLTILTAMADGGRAEQTVDARTLTLPAIQAAHTLGIPVYRAPVDRSGKPEELWWTHPKDPMGEWGKYAWLPKHDCHRPQLPGQPVPVHHQEIEQPEHPPY